MRIIQRPFFLVAVQLVAFWPVWRWYTLRIANSTDELWGLLALVTAVLVLMKQPSLQRTDKGLLWPSLLVLLYTITYPVLPPLGRATIAISSIGITISLFRNGRLFQPGLLGLLYLSLPLLPSLQFYGGFPMRVLVASVTAPILRLGGIAVFREGTCLNWAGQLVWIDAPCSGIRMLWVALYLASTLICLYRIPLLKALSIFISTFPIVIAGNIFRAVALFYIEGGFLDAPTWAHDYAGVIAFLFISASIMFLVNLIRRGNICGETISF